MFLANLPLYKKLTLKRSEKFARYLHKLIPNNSAVLDFGCGNMFTAQVLKEIDSTLDITGIDVIRDQNLNEEHLQKHGLKFELLTTKKLPFEDNTFDITIALAVLHHTDNPEYYVSELSRVTKPTGHIIILEEMYINAIDRIWISSQDWILNKMKEGVPVPLNFRSHKHYLQEFKRQHLKIEFQDGLRAFLTQMHTYVFKLKKSA